MGKFIFDISMSVDGYITGANVRTGAELGDGGERLHEWVFEGTDPRNLEIVQGFVDTGAIICGRTTYDLSIKYWGDGGPVPAARVPVIIVSHSVPNDVPGAGDGGGVYTFVDSIEAAYEMAKELAGDKLVGVQGSNVVQQFLTRGLIDEISIHIVPVLFFSGTPLFKALGEHITLEPITMIDTPEVTHLRYRVVKE